MSETEAEKKIYTVKTGAFEGPLELLLNLVESRKLFINEISLASVTDDFLAYAKSLGTSDLGELTSFLSIAATLILVKSRSLLPGFIVTKEEEQDIADLENRLALYAMIREVGVELSQKYGVAIIHLPPEREFFSSVFAPDPKLTPQALFLAAEESLNRIPKEEILPEIKIRKVVSIEEMLTKLTQRVASALSVSFKEWQKAVGGEDSVTVKKNTIVSFLAMLELVRQGMMDAVQGMAFEDIELTGLKKEVEEETL